MEEKDNLDEEYQVPTERSRIVLISACIIMAIIYLIPVAIGVALSFSSK